MNLGGICRSIEQILIENLPRCGYNICAVDRGCGCDAVERRHARLAARAVGCLRRFWARAVVTSVACATISARDAHITISFLGGTSCRREPSSGSIPRRDLDSF